MLLSWSSWSQDVLLPESLFKIQIKHFKHIDNNQYLFIAPYQLYPELDKYGALVVLDSQYKLVFYKSFPRNYKLAGAKGALVDFRPHREGNLRFFFWEDNSSPWYILDSNFLITDSIRCAGRSTDSHDLIASPDGTDYLMCNEMYHADASDLKDLKGNAYSSETQINCAGCVIQQLDRKHSLLKEWSLKGILKPEDLLLPYRTDTSELHLSHANSIYPAGDTGILISIRNCALLINLSKKSGKPYWTFGGPDSDFRSREKINISHQHHATLQNDTLLLFNNGLHLNPPRPSAVKYLLDLKRHSAERINRISYPDTVSCMARGSYQETKEGNQLICWGDNRQGTHIELYDAKGETCWQMKFSANFQTHRAFLDTLPFSFKRPEISMLPQRDGSVILIGTPGANEYLWNTGEKSESIITFPGTTHELLIRKNNEWFGSGEFHVPLR